MKLIILCLGLFIAVNSVNAKDKYRQVTKWSKKAIVEGDSIKIYSKEDVTTYTKLSENKRTSKYISNDGKEIEVFRPILRWNLLFIDNRKYRKEHMTLPSHIGY